MNKQPWLLSLVIITILATSCNEPKLDEFGGYYDEKLKVYRYVKVPRVSQEISADGLTKPQPDIYQTYHAKVVALSGNIIWFEIEKRPVYTLIAPVLAADFKDPKRSRIGGFLEGVSVTAVSTNDKYRAEVNDTISKIMVGQDVAFKFKRAGRNYAISMIVSLPNGDPDKEEQSLNYWLIKNGLSPYILPSKGELNKNFVMAEDLAQRSKLGIWR